MLADVQPGARGEVTPKSSHLIHTPEHCDRSHGMEFLGHSPSACLWLRGPSTGP